MTADGYLRFAAMVAAAGGVALALHLIWRHILIPTWEFMKHVVAITRAIVVFIEAQPTLIDIAHEFKPNDGDSLRDQIDTANIRLGNIEGQMEILIQRHLWDGEVDRGQATIAIDQQDDEV